MALITIAALALLFKGLEATPVPSPESGRPCVEFTLPVSVTAQNAEYDIIPVNNNIDSTAVALDLDTRTSPTDVQRVIRNITVSDTYNISAQLCVPPAGPKKSHLQIATHGLVYDKRYWDVTLNPSEYSYVNAALAAGYSILTYDRLGTGLSDKPDAYTVVQAPLQLEILRRITELARNGELLKQAAATNNIGNSTGALVDRRVSFEKIIHVGHSYGSTLTSALLSTYGNLSDAAVITGNIISDAVKQFKKTSFDIQYAAQNDPDLFGDRSSGYVVPGTKSAVQTGFFSTRANATSGIGGFEPDLLDYGFDTRQPLVYVEFVSPAQLNLGVAQEFTGPVQIVLGEFDFPVCAGDCKGLFDPATYKALYPKAPPVTPYIQQGAGHGLTMHRRADVGYKATLDWLDSNGL